MNASSIAPVQSFPLANPFGVVALDTESGTTLAYVAFAGGVAQLMCSNGVWSPGHTSLVPAGKPSGLALSEDKTLLASVSAVNSGGGWLSFFDPQNFGEKPLVSREFDSSLQLGAPEVCFDATGAYAYVSIENSATVCVVEVNGSSGPTILKQRLPVASTPAGIAVYNGQLWVISEGNEENKPCTGTVQIYDLTNPKSPSDELKTLIYKSPVRVAFSTVEGNDYAWLSARGPNQYCWGNDVYGMLVSNLMKENGDISSVTSTGPAPVPLHVFGDGRYLAVGNSNRFPTPTQGSLTVLDIRSVLPPEPSPRERTVNVGEFPRGICTTPDGSQLLLTNYTSGEVWIFDTSDLIPSE